MDVLGCGVADEILVIVFVVGDMCDGSFVESDADFEAYRLQRTGSDIDGELLHLVVVRPVLIVVARALVDEERDDDVGIDFAAYRDHLRLSVAGHDVRVRACSAERVRAYRSSSLDIWLAHGGPFFLTSIWLDHLGAELRLRVGT